MENKNLKKKIALALTPVLVLSLIVLFSTVPESLNADDYYNDFTSSMQNEYSAEEQKSEVPSHESVYLSIFKFIVNCNPFQKETQQ